jgi:hypothetical protein
LFSDQDPSDQFMRLKTFLLVCVALLPSVAAATDKSILGLNEYVRLDLDVIVEAKLDTGAQTASLSARDIERFRRNGERWVRFYPALDEVHAHPIERPLARVSKIKRRSGDFDPQEDKTYTARPVIELEMCIGHTKKLIEVNLTDRSAFQFPLLIGSDALKEFDVLIDPSLRYAAGQPDCTTVATSGE